MSIFTPFECAQGRMVLPLKVPECIYRSEVGRFDLESFILTVLIYVALGR